MENIDKRLRAEQFRDRMARALRETGLSQSALARAAGVDRSTISQLLAPETARMPNAQVVAACATALGVSSDWLLSLSDRPESAAQLLAASMSLTEAPRALVDERIFAWHREAEGYKIRHVPAALPDMLKTRALIEWEYAPHLGRTANQAIGASQDRLDWMRQANSDYEIALPIYEIDTFARAEGYYFGLSEEIRLEQLDRLELLATQLYPRLRLSLFDARKLYSSPITLFGPLLAVIYIGSHYLAFRDRERVEIFTAHFDRLVREASYGARDVPRYIRGLRAQITGLNLPMRSK